VNSINAAAGATGAVTLRGGNVIVGVPGIVATGTVNLTGVSGSINVNGGGNIKAPATILNSTSPSNTVNWTVNTSAATGAGSLNDVLTNVNQFSNSSTITIANGSNYVVTLSQALPQLTRPVTLDGNGNLTIVGTRVGSSSGLVLAGNGITVRGLTLTGFSGGGAGIFIKDSRNSNVSNVTVSNSTTGLLATGNLAGTTVQASRFQYDRTGVQLTSASNFTLANNKITNSATHGLSITSLVNQNNGGTRIYGNQFSFNPTAISLAAATGASLTSRLQIGLPGFAVNTIDNSTVGLLATGFCTYTTVHKLQFTTAVRTPYNVVNSRNLTVVR
jgi:hypothetical protein